MVDMGNGTYQVRFKQPKEIQDIKIEIYYEDEQKQLVPIRGSPFSSGFKAGVPAKNNELTGPQLLGYITSQIKEHETFIS